MMLCLSCKSWTKYRRRDWICDQCRTGQHEPHRTAEGWRTPLGPPGVQCEATGSPTGDDPDPGQATGPPTFDVYRSDIDGVWVIHVDTHHEAPENDHGPMLRIYVNDGGPVYANPSLPLAHP